MVDRTALTAALAELDGLIARLRDPVTGCGWLRAQDALTLAPYVLEEAYEVVEALEQGSDEARRDELGDLLFQVVLQSRIATEVGRFELTDVVQALTAKLRDRYRDVLAAPDPDATATDAQKRWERRKAAERTARSEGGGAGALAGVDHALPALTRAWKLQRRAARVGFDWPDAVGPAAKVEEELAEVRAAAAVDPDAPAVAEEVGDLLFAAVNLARHLGVDPEQALRGANRKFERRFHHVERILRAAGRDPASASLAEMDKLWDEAKARERTAGPGASDDTTRT